MQGTVTLEDFASANLRPRPGELFNPPGLTDFLGCVQAAPGVMAINHLTFPPYSHGDTLLGTLTVNGRCLARSGLEIAYRWRPDRITREAALDGLHLATRTVLGVGARTAGVALTVRNDDSGSRRVRLEIRAAGGVVCSRDGWRTPYSPREAPSISVTPWEGTPPPESLVRNRVERLADGSGLRFGSETSRAFSLQTTAPKPDAIERTTFRFEFELSAGAARTLHYLVAVGPDPEALDRLATGWRSDPEAMFRAAETFWTDEVSAAFTPGNDRYSGHLPVLQTENADLRRIYLNAVIGAIYFKREPAESAYGRTYTTLMPRYWVTTSFVNDWSLSAWLLASLDPECVRKHVELWLTRDLDAHFGTEYVSGADQGNWYSCNDFALCRLISAYLRVTGDQAWLDARVGDRTVLAHLQRIAERHARLDRGTGLADCGDRNSLLEAVGAYEHEVASLNAAHVWVLRETAAVLDHREDRQAAAEYRRRAATLIPRIGELYVPGEGHWNCRLEDGSLVPVRHAWDFVHTVNFLHRDLAPGQLAEMIEFFERELRTEAWMHALSPLDDDADFSLRPDHQWNGSYPAWVALAALALVRADRLDLLARWVPGLARSANQGPYSQAHFVESFAAPEQGGARKAPTDWPYINDWAILAAGAFFELFLHGLFGVEMGFDAVRATPRLERFDPGARLERLRWRDRLFTVDREGVHPG
jgi:hypothetical protein